MIEKSEPKKTKKTLNTPIDRIPLTKKSRQIVENSIGQLAEKYPGVKLSKKDFVNWLVEDSFGRLTHSDEKLLFEKFYDELKYLAHSLKDLKRKKQNGEDISNEKIIKQIKPIFKKDNSKPQPIALKNSGRTRDQEVTNPAKLWPS